MYAVLVGVFALSISLTTSAMAYASPGVVISQFQPADSSAAGNEAVEIYNNSEIDQDITNWCLRYSSYSALTTSSGPKYCFTAPESDIKIFLATHSYAVITTTGYHLPDSASPDGLFSSSGMAASGGHMWLEDEQRVVDVLGWGSAQYAEGYLALINPAPPAPTATQTLYRKEVTPELLQDTDNNRDDFELTSPLMRTGGLYEMKIVTDVCGNLDEVQATLPDEYGYDEAGNCEPLARDMCTNIDLIQLELPPGMMATDSNECYADVCDNLEGLQIDVPVGYTDDGEVCTAQEFRIIELNEVLPNVTGSDTGHEFIELYNPNAEPISLAGYLLMIGKNLEKSIVLADMTLPPQSFVVFYDNEFGFTLLNTESKLRLVAPAGNIVSETSYTDSKEDESWSLLTGAWQYTNQPTPGDINAPSENFSEDSPVVAAVAPCSAGKYRHPITNRCRNIETDTAMLVPCDNDEYRNPETNRCRKVATLAATLAPCAEGSTRNPETNRCRKVAGVSTTLTPCQVGYERNIETNRCRKTAQLAAVTSSPAVPTDRTGATLQNTLMATAGAGALGYGLYEWRSEFFRGIRRIGRVLSSK